MRIITRAFDYCRNCSHRNLVELLTGGRVKVTCTADCGQEPQTLTV